MHLLLLFVWPLFFSASGALAQASPTPQTLLTPSANALVQSEAASASTENRANTAAASAAGVAAQQAQGSSGAGSSTQSSAQLKAQSNPQPASAPALLTAPHAGVLPLQLKLVHLYHQADALVKGIMLLLLFASMLSWTLLLVKGRSLRRLIRTQQRLLSRLSQARNLKEARLLTRDCQGSQLLQLASRELLHSSDVLHDTEGVKERVHSAFQRYELACGRAAGQGVGLLATIGSTAPFIGLLGTVWGIMNSFIGIAAAQSSNLAVVAPGIAEALLATALGLLAAIPGHLQPLCPPSGAL